MPTSETCKPRLFFCRSNMEHAGVSQGEKQALRVAKIAAIYPVSGLSTRALLRPSGTHFAQYANSDEENLANLPIANSAKEIAIREFEQILCPVDLSALFMEALRLGVAVAKTEAALLDILHVILQALRRAVYARGPNGCARGALCHPGTVFFHRGGQRYCCRGSG